MLWVVQLLQYPNYLKTCRVSQSHSAHGFHINKPGPCACAHRSCHSPMKIPVVKRSSLHRFLQDAVTCSTWLVSVRSGRIGEAHPKPSLPLNNTVAPAGCAGVGVPDDGDAVRVAGRASGDGGRDARNHQRHPGQGGCRLGAQRRLQVPARGRHRRHLEGRRAPATQGQAGAPLLLFPGHSMTLYSCPVMPQMTACLQGACMVLGSDQHE